MKFYVKRFDFSAGLQTKSNEDGKPANHFAEFRNVRTAKGGANRRDGRVNIGQISSPAKATVFDGVADLASAAIDTRVWALGQRFRVEGLFSLGSTSGTQPLIQAGSTTAAMTLQVTGGNFQWDVWDSSGTKDTLTLAASTGVHALQLTRNGADLTMRLDNDSTDTDTMDATKSLRTPVGDLRVCWDGTNFGDYDVDYLRVFSEYKDNHADRLLRYADPRSQSCLADYDFGQLIDLADDRSRFGNHLDFTSSPSTTASLSHKPSQIQLVEGYKTREERRIGMVSGGRIYVIEVK